MVDTVDLAEQVVEFFKCRVHGRSPENISAWGQCRALQPPARAIKMCIRDRLNNGGIIEYSAGNIYAPNGDAIWNQGIMPDIEKSVSLNDYMSGNDSVRKYAIEYINNYTK